MHNLEKLAPAENKIDIPKKYVIVVIDPQKGFVGKYNTFAKVFGPEELVKMQEAISNTGKFIKRITKWYSNYLCKI